MNRSTRSTSLAVGAASLVGSGMAAATAPDYSTILSGLDAGDAVVVFIAAAAVLAAVGFGKWISKKVGKYFG